MPDTNQLAATALRITLGVIMLAHSLLLKLVIFGLEGTAAYFTSQGLPPLLAYLTFAVEAVSGMLLILGRHVRAAALALIPFMLGAAVAVHAANGWLFSAPGGGWEYPVLLAILCAIQALIGRGERTVSPRLLQVSL